MKKSPAGDHNGAPRQIPVHEKAGRAVSIAVRTLGVTAVAALAPGVATLSVETASAAEKSPKAEVAKKFNRAKEMKQVERKLEQRINDGRPVRYIDAAVQVMRKKTQPSTGGAEAFIPVGGPESQGMADDNEGLSPMDRYSVYYIDRPMVAKGKSGREYLAYFDNSSPEVELTMVPFDSRAQIIEDDFHTGEMSRAQIMSSNTAGVWDTSRAVDLQRDIELQIAQRAEIDYN